MDKGVWRGVDIGERQINRVKWLQNVETEVHGERMNYLNLLILFHLFPGWKVVGGAIYEQCVNIVTLDVNDCKIHGVTNSTTSSCVSNAICNKTFHVTIVKLEPYSSLIIPAISHIL